jgi:hypothetical protein
MHAIPSGRHLPASQVAAGPQSSALMHVQESAKQLRRQAPVPSLTTPGWPAQSWLTPLHHCVALQSMAVLHVAPPPLPPSGPASAAGALQAIENSNRRSEARMSSSLGQVVARTIPDAKLGGLYEISGRRVQLVFGGPGWAKKPRVESAEND